VGVQRAYQSHAGSPLITLEASQLVWRDAQLTPTVVATGVDELVPLHEAVAFLAGRTLGIFDETVGLAILDDDTCELRSLDGADDSRGFSFLSPCEQHTLRVHSANTAQIYTIAEPADGAGAHVAVSPYYGDDRVQVVTDGRSLTAPDSRWVGTLWGGRLSDPATTPVTLKKWGESAFAAPFGDGGCFGDLSLASLDVFDGDDSIWARFQTTGDAHAFGAQWAAFSRASVFPTLAAALDDQADPVRRTRFIDALEASVAARLATTPERMRIPLARMLLVKSAGS